MSDSTEGPKHPIDELIDAAREYRDGRLQSLGMVYPACMFNIVWREYFRNVLEAVCDADNGFLKEEDYDDNFVELKLAFQQKRAINILGEVAEAKEDCIVAGLDVLLASAADAAAAEQFDQVQDENSPPPDVAAASAASATCDAANEEIQAVDEIVVAIERLASVPKPATRTATKAKKSGR